MSAPSPETPFADLVSRYLDGTAGAAERQALSQALQHDAERGREFASQARFESMLRRACRRDAKALFEFAALEAASDVSADIAGFDGPGGVVTAPAVMVPAGAVAPPRSQPQQHRPVRWRTADSPWLKIAALFLVLATSAALWFNWEEQVQTGPHVAGTTAPAMLPVMQVRSADEKQVVLLAPRQHTAPASSPAPAAPVPEAAKALTLAERLEDFYLPAVHLHQVRAQDAADWLTAQLRQHNYARRPDLNQLRLQLPPSVASRIVTLESGPISFKKAVEIVTTLAGGVATIGEKSIQVVDRATPAGTGLSDWQPSPWGKESTQQRAADLGIALEESMLKEEAGGATSLRLPTDQQRALGLLADSQKRLESLAPLSFVPLMVPSGAVGAGRVLTASEVDSIRLQLASAANAGALPTISVPFGAGSQGTSLLNGAGDTAITLKVTPVGEMNQVTIQPTTTTPTTTNLLADNGSAPAPTRVDAVLDNNQGVITSLGEDGTTQYYTAEGIPIPPGYEFLYGFFAAPPEDPSGSALLLVPVP
ncbi:MAG: hypothetical protein ACO1TE_09535 [Prosthecobacter sp.]